MPPMRLPAGPRCLLEMYDLIYDNQELFRLNAWMKISEISRYGLNGIRSAVVWLARSWSALRGQPANGQKLDVNSTRPCRHGRRLVGATRT